MKPEDNAKIAAQNIAKASRKKLYCSGIKSKKKPKM
jgi:hypothetical protein